MKRLLSLSAVAAACALFAGQANAQHVDPAGGTAGAHWVDPGGGASGAQVVDPAGGVSSARPGSRNRISFVCPDTCGRTQAPVLRGLRMVRSGMLSPAGYFQRFVAEA